MKMNWKIKLLVFTICSTVGCEDQVENSTDTTTINYSTETATTTFSTAPPTITKQGNVADAINDFGYKLLTTMMKQNKDQNVVISPTSVAGLLAMILVGTVGKAYDELAGALGFSLDILQNRRNHEQFGQLLGYLNSNDTTSKTLYADAVFVDTHSYIREMYRNYLSRVYNGEARSVDFTKSEETRDLINEWVENHTEGKIENFLQKTLPSSTKAVLLSALYFSSQWKTPFLPHYTTKWTFNKPGAEVNADMMLNMAMFDYTFSIDYDMHMIALPYNDSATTLYALMPTVPHRQNLFALMNRLDSAKIDQLITTMKRRECVIRFPKMDLKTNTKLQTPLKALGVQSLFVPGEANFALMVDDNAIPKTTEDVIVSSRFGALDDVDDEARKLKERLDGLSNPGVYVDSVLHDVMLKIDEYGTEATAATSGVMARTARLFYADSPFYMFIRNERTKLVTFSAAIFDPTE